MADSNWQDYLKNLLGTKVVSQAAIAGTDGSILAHSQDFEPSQDDIKELAHFFNNTQEAPAKGFSLAGVKYTTLRIDDRSFYGTKDPGGAVAVKTAQLILIGIYGEGQTLNNAANVFEKFADSLLENGF